MSFLNLIRYQLRLCQLKMDLSIPNFLKTRAYTKKWLTYLSCDFWSGEVTMTIDNQLQWCNNDFL